MASETVRIQPSTHAKLKALACELGQSMPEVLAVAVDGLYRQRFLEDCNRAYARLKADPEAWREELDERKAWNTTLADGLKNENRRSTRKGRNMVRRSQSRARP